MPNRRTWADGPNGQTPINATRLNALETDLTQALDGAEAAQASVASIETNLTTALAGSVTPDPDNPGFYLIGAPTNG